MTFITTASGIRFHLTEPVAHEIFVTDIAHALAAVNRFSGHANLPYSVAQHSVHVAAELEKLCPEGRIESKTWALYGLLHDASEAYLGDISSPLKNTDALAGYRAIEARLQSAIYSALGLSSADVPSRLKEIDLRMAMTEWRDLMPRTDPWKSCTLPPFDWHIEPWSFAVARETFLETYYELNRW